MATAGDPDGSRLASMGAKAEAEPGTAASSSGVDPSLTCSCTHALMEGDDTTSGAGTAPDARLATSAAAWLVARLESTPETAVSAAALGAAPELELPATLLSAPTMLDDASPVSEIEPVATLPSTVSTEFETDGSDRLALLTTLAMTEAALSVPEADSAPDDVTALMTERALETLDAGKVPPLFVSTVIVLSSDALAALDRLVLAEASPEKRLPSAASAEDCTAALMLPPVLTTASTSAAVLLTSDELALAEDRLASRLACAVARSLPFRLASCEVT